MKFRRRTLADGQDIDGVAVVIDVLRAFTTAAWALHRGATDIVMATTVAEAYSLRRRWPGALIMGEVNALPVAGFDLPNSPSAIASAQVRDRRLVQRTTTGTQGVRLAGKAPQVFAASLVVAAATARALKQLEPARVTFVETGRRAGDPGDEDVACADYIEGLLRGSPPNRAAILERVKVSRAGRRFADPRQPDFPAADLELALDLDRFDFAMAAEWRDDQLALVTNS